MDAVTDLTARAVSFITLIQDTFLSGYIHGHTAEATFNNIDILYETDFEAKFSQSILNVKNGKNENSNNDGKKEGEGKKIFEEKVVELTWLSEQSANDGKPAGEEEKQYKNAERHLIKLCVHLAVWITNNQASFIEKLGRFGAFSPPNKWREAISDIIYSDAEQRVSLAEALEYLPLSIVLALANREKAKEEKSIEYTASNPRILQWWQKENEPDEMIILTTAEKELQNTFKKDVYESNEGKGEVDKFYDSDEGKQKVNKFYTERIKSLLENHEKLKAALLQNNLFLPFEYVFSSELDEISAARKLREKDYALSSNDFSEKQEQTEAAYVNSFERAKKAKPVALALSGGGIRSATFNLGVLQGLAKYKFINKVDYLSTVSGGGYIGSWLATWIKRDGSVTKVSDRLNPETSPDPLSEEVRPIRWLRMFSNYLNPDKSIMSVDSWTIGITWLRNTLLNQLVIFLLLFSALLLARSFYEFWKQNAIWITYSSEYLVYVISCLFLLLIAFLAGISMRWYDRGRVTLLPFNLHNYVTFIIILIAITGAYMVSASLFSLKTSDFLYQIGKLWPSGTVTFFVLILISAYGRYDKCIASFNKTRFETWGIIISTAVLSTAIGLVSLAGAWDLLELMKTKTNPVLPDKTLDALAFTIGVPLMFLVFSITVVSRMALLGRYFPDERREWWGRTGAAINRIGFMWIVISASSFLLGPTILSNLSKFPNWAPVGGWMALVGGTVKAASSKGTSGKEQPKGFQSTALEILSKAGPYIFILGLLIFLPVIMKPLIDNRFLPSVMDWLVKHHCLPAGMGRVLGVKALFLAILFGLPGIWLSWTLGVNEFSMHHFYRNRLVRAYLGATRRKASREQTSNPFTGFDNLDDEKLSKFKYDNGYFGPYPILNAALNASQVSELDRQDRKAESFIFSPLYCGFDFSKARASASSVKRSYDYGYRPTEKYAYPNDDGPGLGTAMAISGAAANPNQGFHSSAGTAFLLTVFNVQLGWWVGNPRRKTWKTSGPNHGLAYIFYNLIGKTNTSNRFVSLSDGGHFDNMGLYEMIRRRCSFIIVGDGEQDDNFTCEGLANAIRRCRIDFGAEITINTDEITKREGRFSKKHYAIGKIKYSGEEAPSGVLLYLKSSLTGDESVDVIEYGNKNPTFPHQTTADQFFDEEQFESYRKLGVHIIDQGMKDETFAALIS